MKRLTKSELKRDWLNWFRMTVRMARDSRLHGNMTAAIRQDELIERYYKDAPQYGYNEDTLYEIESAIRS